MSVTSLPPHPNFRQLQIQAKELLRDQRRGDADACTRIHAGLPRLEHLRPEEVAATRVSLQEAQHVLAREYGYSTWSALRAAAEGQTEVVWLLLSHGADPSLKDADGDTAESFAREKAHTAVLELLRDPPPLVRK